MQALPVSKVKDRLAELDERGCTHTRQVSISREASAGTAGRSTKISKVSCRAGGGPHRVPSTSNNVAHRIQILRIDHAAFMGEFPPVVLSWFVRR
jgi:hypothetical protein